MQKSVGVAIPFPELSVNPLGQEIKAPPLPFPKPLAASRLLTAQAPSPLTRRATRSSLSVSPVV